MSGPNFGILTNFDHVNQSWKTYKSKLKQYFIANDLDDAKDAAGTKRKAILLSALSEGTFKLATDLALPKQLDEVPFEDILTLLDGHFTPTRVGFGERHNFYSASQQPGESHTQWAARLRGLTAHCGFTNVEDTLRDRFVMGMLPGQEKEKLYAQSLDDLTLAKAVQLAENIRCAREGAAASKAEPGSNADQLFKITKGSKRNEVHAKVPCTVCGYSNHKPAECRFSNFVCKKCNVKGHLRRMCTKVKYVNLGTEDEGDDDGVEPEGKDGGGAVSAASNTADGKPEEAATQCVVGGAHAVILRISSYFGLAPLKFESRSNGFKVTISSAMVIYSYTLVTVLVICTIFGLATEINIGVELSVRMSSRMSQVVSTCDVLVVVATAGAGVYGAPRRMRDMLKFMDSVASVDNSVGAQYSVVNERKLCAVLLGILIFFTVLITDDFCFYVLQATKFDRQWDIVTNYIGFYLLWYVVMVLELQFAFTALSVRKRFNAVNDAIAITAKHVAVPLEKLEQPTSINMFAIRVAPAGPRRSASNVSLLVDSMPGAVSDHPIIIRKNVNGDPRLIVPPCEAVRRLAALHGTLCEVVQRIDRSYGLPLVVVLLSTLLHLIVTPYFLIMEIIVSTNRIHFLVLQFLWCVTHMLRMFVVVEPCHYTITEGKRTEELVCQLMTYAPSGGALPSRLELFSRQLMLRSVTYSPLGICTLDRPLVASVIGAVTTYLVILIQFQRYDS